MKFQRFALTLIVSSVVMCIPNFVRANPLCAYLFEIQPQSLATLMASISNPVVAPLTPAMQAMIRKHPIWRHQAAQSNGQGILFKFARTGHTFLEHKEVKSGEMGESIQ